MSLAAGTRLGPYEILEPIGKGGMGEVYRARDTKLDREVAIKVLPEEFAKDKERLARFEREAKVLASLNHPNIASIYGLEESDGVKALVLELVEGLTLAERIAKGVPSGAARLEDWRRGGCRLQPWRARQPQRAQRSFFEFAKRVGSACRSSPVSFS